jgi:hypothetical protein
MRPEVKRSLGELCGISLRTSRFKIERFVPKKKSEENRHHLCDNLPQRFSKWRTSGGSLHET